MNFQGPAKLRTIHMILICIPEQLCFSCSYHVPQQIMFKSFLVLNENTSKTVICLYSFVYLLVLDS